MAIAKQQFLWDRVCLSCGQPLAIKIKRDLLRKNYCSPSCRAKGSADTERFRISEVRNCLKCGKEFLAVRSRHRYCTQACQESAATMRCLLKKNTIQQYLSRLAWRSGRRLEPSFILKLWDEQQGKCAITRLQMTHALGEGYKHTNASLDRIIPGSPYEIGNLQLVCRAANMMKQDFTSQQLLEWCRLILEKANSIIDS